MKEVLLCGAIGAALLMSLSACQTPGSSPVATLPVPSACRGVSQEAPKLILPATETPKLASAGDTSGLDIAQVHTVNRALDEAGVWETRSDGWSVLRLDIRSERARTLAVRINELQPRAGVQTWLCGEREGEHAGPFRAAPNGQLWTPQHAGAQLRLEIWLPSAERRDFSGMLADVYGGYR